MSTATTESKASVQGAGLRPITRAEEGRVRVRLASLFSCLPALHYDHNGRLTSIALRPDEHSGEHQLTDDERAMVGRMGIVPGPEGWCWAAPAVEAAPPAWLTAAVLAALPPDGTPVAATVVNGIPYHLVGECIASIPDDTQLTDAMVGLALSALVMNGEIEVSHDEDGRATWRRWGVPEGWGFIPSGVTGCESLTQGTADVLLALAEVWDDGHWTLYESEKSSRVKAQDTATPPTLDAAKRAALRACWERGLFGPARVVSDDGGPPVLPTLTAADGRAVVAAHVDGDRAQRVRDALGVALVRPTEILVLLDIVRHSAMRVGAQMDIGATEVREALVSIGAVEGDGGWRLSDWPPPGWGWHSGHFGGLYLTPSTSRNIALDSIANVAADGSRWIVTEHGKLIACGVDKDDEAAMAAALLACRRAGLFAPPLALSPRARAVLDDTQSTYVERAEAVLGVEDVVLRFSGRNDGDHIITVWVGEREATAAELDRLRAAGLPVGAPPTPAKNAPTLLDLLAPSDDSLIAKGRRKRFAAAIEALSAGIEDRAVRACLDARRGAQLRAEAAERRAQEEIDRAERAEAERDATAEDLDEIKAALDLSVPALPLESLVSRVRRMADDRRRFYNDAKAEHAEAERLRAVVDHLQPIAAAAERFVRALGAAERERTDSAELDAALTALRALFGAPDGTVRQ